MGVLLLICLVCIYAAQAAADHHHHDSIIAQIAKLNERSGKELYQFDIVLTDEQKERRDAGLPILEKRGAVPHEYAGDAWHWHTNEIHYEFDNYYWFYEYEKNWIRAALAELGSLTCLNFVEGTAGVVDYIHILNGAGCWSYIGRVGGSQDLSLQSNNEGSCLWNGIIQHEFLHALSFWHEQSRLNRDDYVTINYPNIEEEVWTNFEITYHEWISSQGFGYNYGSVMHYDMYAFAINEDCKTIIPKRLTSEEIGQRDSLSDLDIWEVNSLYHCGLQVDGQLGPWSPWSSCPQTCGVGGTQTRTRQCDYPPPSVTPPGAPCTGATEESRDCVSIGCPIDYCFEHRGCWWDYCSPLLASLENTNNTHLDGDYQTRSEPGRKCARAAVSVDMPYFALRNGGECYATLDPLSYQTHGESTECVNGFGGVDCMDVYEILNPDTDVCIGCRRFVISSNRKKWDDAKSYCETQGGWLAKMETEFINTQIIDNIYERGLELGLDIRNGLWIGLNDRDNEDNFVWHDNTTVTYTNWHGNNPGNSIKKDPDGQDCVKLLKKKAYKWDDDYCGFVTSRKRNYICELNNGC